MERQARQLPYLNFQMRYPYLNQWGGRLCPTIGFALPNIFRDYAPGLYFVNGSLKGAKNLTCSINLQFPALQCVPFFDP